MIMISNRDEFHERPTAVARHWPENPEIYGGRDLREGGTWLGLHQSGRFAAVTNYREPGSPAAAQSRGKLVTDYLTSSSPTRNHLELLRLQQRQYGGFNLLAGDDKDLFYISNRCKQAGYPLKPGFYSLSNHLLNSPWPKVQKAKQIIESQVKAYGESLQLQSSNSFVAMTEMGENLIKGFRDEQQAPDDELPDTGVGFQIEKMLSSIFIKTPGYGTRCSTFFAKHVSGKSLITEMSYQPDGKISGQIQTQLTPDNWASN
ncbi:MAG: NRDE family protein [Pseudomonadales bacterium]|nr:NRDE family protein [Pseudomonadales bacterium]